jgi:hypothetical protein
LAGIAEGSNKVVQIDLTIIYSDRNINVCNAFRIFLPRGGDMDKDKAFADPCTEAARRMARARETLANSRSQEARASAASEYESLMETVAETQFFTEGCYEPGEDANPDIDFHRDLYGRDKS